MEALPPRRLHTVAVFSGAYGGLALLMAGLFLSSNNEEIDKLSVALVFIIASFLAFMICIGANRRRRWAWWLGVISYGVITLASVAGLFLGLSPLLFGTDPHGGGAGGFFFLTWAGLSLSVLCGIPLWCLARGRKEIRD